MKSYVVDILLISNSVIKSLKRINGREVSISPQLAMQLNINPNITFKQHNSKLRDRKCLSDIHNLSYKQQK